jgi:hypothetical protein
MCLAQQNLRIQGSLGRITTRPLRRLDRGLYPRLIGGLSFPGQAPIAYPFTLGSWNCDELPSCKRLPNLSDVLQYPEKPYSFK